MLRKRFPLLLILPGLLLCLSGFSQAPQGYYDSAAGLSGQSLFIALNQIIKNHNQQTYNSLWSHFQQTDKKSNGKVWDMYSDIPGSQPPYQFTFVTDQCGNYSGEGDCYNREHSWPASWFNDTYPAYSDLFHLYPTDGYVNNRRSNYAFGVVSAAVWTSQNGSKLGPNTYPGFTGTVFEPIDAYKGDFARSYFYMMTRYYGQDNSWASSDMTIKSAIKAWAIPMLLAWHLADTVSDKEIERNNSVYSIQGNRNPYIDNPFWVRAIWGPDAGIQTLSSNFNAMIFPNPATENCRIICNGTSSNGYIISLFSLDGKMLNIEVQSFEEGYEINTSLLPKGLYIIRVEDPASRVRLHLKLSIITQD